MLRFGIFGAGFIGKVHAENIANHPRAELAYIYDVNTEAANALQSRLGGKVASSPDEIFNASDVDAVLIASSTNTHADLLSAAIDAGKPVICEKPIDLDIERVKAVALKAKGKNLPIVLGFSRRFDADYAELQQRVVAREIGQLEVLHLVARGPKPPPISYVKVSGGQYRDQTIHYFDLAAWISEEQPVEVYAVGSALADPAIGEAGDVDTSLLTLKLPSGAMVSIDNTRRSAYGYDERIEAFGADGMIEAGRKYLSNVMRYGGDSIRMPALYAGWFERIETSFRTFLDAFIRAQEGEDLVLPSLWDGLRAQQMAEAATESLKTNRPVKIDYWMP
jgi:myo-inositol 2-dehydrogenase/D-chiro-inositol 1-dehydrogenase